ncbi:hypothetical protein SAMN05443575_2115 [Jatrophihabitans endophyticus]|uniref:NAD(P)-binding domain-containing protein n=1 Tax=Jatrophihabitans endophyticus TaxID=1206085 RepID=A0A1M5KCJ9_9ACTN|nr:NAD(P)H-binding protein [Jatrophihabitans endophyticus]SHG50515.1 hypothetical protein SAMN05443575_2115 [Jatrophihabitans endophyticus]
MRIAVYGGTGQAGTEIVAEAARRGHEVTALSRREPTAELPAGVTWRHGELTDTADVAAVAGGADVVVTAFGPSREPGGNPGAFASQLVPFLHALNGTPVLVVGGAGSLVDADGVRLVDGPEFPDAYKAEALAAADALAAVRDLGDEVAWTFLSPAPVIQPGERTGSYRSGADSPVGTSISFADFAIAVVDEVERPTHRRQRWTVATD